MIYFLRIYLTFTRRHFTALVFPRKQEGLLLQAYKKKVDTVFGVFKFTTLTSFFITAFIDKISLSYSPSLNFFV